MESPGRPPLAGDQPASTARSFASRRVSWPLLVALLALLVLAALPPSGWLVRAQLGGLVGPFPWLAPMLSDLGIKEVIVPISGGEDMHPRMRAVAARVRDDYRVQIAAAERAQDRTAACRELLRRFPRVPAVWAAYAAKASVTDAGHSEYSPSPPERAGAYADRLSGAERLDPDNAFFPMMRAAALFVAHRDAEALAALHRAAACPRWDDYLGDEAAGARTLWLAAGGDTGAIPRMGVIYSVRLPHLAQMRHLAWSAAKAAADLEHAGKEREGFEVRQGVLQAAKRMRLQARSLFTARTAAAMACTALSSPRASETDASLYGQGLTKEEAERQAQRDLEQFSARAERLGILDAAELARQERAADEAVTTIARDAPNELPYGRRMARLAGWWLAGLALLGNAAWMVVMAGLASLLLRSGRLADGRPLAPPARWGALMGGVAAAAAIVVGGWVIWLNGQVSEEAPISIWLGVGAGTLALALALPAALASRAQWPVVSRFWRAGGVAVVAWLVGALAVWWTARAGWGLAGGCYAIVWPHYQCGPQPLSPAEAAMRAVSLAWPGLVVVFPVASLLALGVASLRRREPLAAGVARGLSRLASPVACALLLAYACVVPFTLREEARMQAAMDQALLHEGRYVARALCREWPGEAAVPSPASARSARADVPCGH